MAASDNAEIVEKIPFFRGLSPNQVKQILNTGQMSAYEQGHILANDGDKSTAMYILLTGSLTIKSSEVELARVLAVDIVGEMGVVTNEPRCAQRQADRCLFHRLRRNSPLPNTCRLG